MASQVLSFFRRVAKVEPADWSAREVAEFYRVEAALIQAGLRVSSERGVTDEGDPWFVFCRDDDDEVIIHFARIDGRYIISAPSYCGDASGSDFSALVREMIGRHPVLRPQPRNDNLFFHPSALLVMLVASALLKSGHADAAAPLKAAELVAAKERAPVIAALAAAVVVALVAEAADLVAAVAVAPVLPVVMKVQPKRRASDVVC